MAVDEVVGNERAFEELYNAYAGNVFRYALTVLGQQADAEDATQTTFLNAYRALQRGEHPQQPERWLISIAHNTCRQRYRHAQRRPREVSLDEAMTIAGIDDSEKPTAEELKQALMHLPPAQRSALVLREFEGRSYAEAATALQISGSALESLLFRARESLREQLAEPLSCSDAVRAISMQLDGTLSDRNRLILRAHLRTCEECATRARSLRAQKRTLPRLLSLPAWIGRLFPGGLGGASATGGIGAAGLVLKTAAIVAVGSVIGGGVYEGATHVAVRGAQPGRTPNVSRAPASPRSADRAAPHLPGTSASGSPSSGAGTAASPSTPVPGPVTADPAVQPSGATGDAQGSSGAAAVQDATTRSIAVGSAAADTGSSGAPVDSPASSPATQPPGQAKKLAKVDAAAASSAAKVPPGQAKKATDATASGDGSVPPGQAKKDTSTASPGSGSTAAQDSSSAPSVPPGQAKKATDAAASGNGGVPPGQAKKDTSTAPSDPASTAAQDSSSAPSVPPGQAKKDANAAPPDPASTTSTTTSTPATSQDASPGTNVPPGQAKKSGNGH